MTATRGPITPVPKPVGDGEKETATATVTEDAEGDDCEPFLGVGPAKTPTGTVGVIATMDPDSSNKPWGSPCTGSLYTGSSCAPHLTCNPQGVCASISEFGEHCGGFITTAATLAGIADLGRLGRSVGVAIKKIPDCSVMRRTETTRRDTTRHDTTDKLKTIGELLGCHAYQDKDREFLNQRVAAMDYSDVICISDDESDFFYKKPAGSSSALVSFDEDSECDTGISRRRKTPDWVDEAVLNLEQAMSRKNLFNARRQSRLIAKEPADREIAVPFPRRNGRSSASASPDTVRRPDPRNRLRAEDLSSFVKTSADANNGTSSQSEDDPAGNDGDEEQETDLDRSSKAGQGQWRVKRQAVDPLPNGDVDDNDAAAREQQPSEREFVSVGPFARRTFTGKSAATWFQGSHGVAASSVAAKEVIGRIGRVLANEDARVNAGTSWRIDDEVTIRRPERDDATRFKRVFNGTSSATLPGVFKPALNVSTASSSSTPVSPPTSSPEEGAVKTSAAAREDATSRLSAKLALMREKMRRSTEIDSSKVDEGAPSSRPSVFSSPRARFTMWNETVVPSTLEDRIRKDLEAKTTPLTATAIGCAAAKPDNTPTIDPCPPTDLDEDVEMAEGSADEEVEVTLETDEATVIPAAEEVEPSVTVALKAIETEQAEAPHATAASAPLAEVAAVDAHDSEMEESEHEQEQDEEETAVVMDEDERDDEEEDAVSETDEEEKGESEENGKVEVAERAVCEGGQDDGAEMSDTEPRVYPRVKARRTAANVVRAKVLEADEDNDDMSDDETALAELERDRCHHAAKAACQVSSDAALVVDTTKATMEKVAEVENGAIATMNRLKRKLDEMEEVVDAHLVMLREKLGAVDASEVTGDSEAEVVPVPLQVEAEVAAAEVRVSKRPRTRGWGGFALKVIKDMVVSGVLMAVGGAVTLGVLSQIDE
ncbi:hypothetical protein HK101_001804 [Irineochytrium annulatum]|nr:hypothetical protein HK101_001804 [Irineochytrium annulatum]